MSPLSAFCDEESESNEYGGYSHTKPDAKGLLTNLSERRGDSFLTTGDETVISLLERPEKSLIPPFIVNCLSRPPAGLFLKNEKSFEGKSLLITSITKPAAEISSSIEVSKNTIIPTKIPAK